MDLGGLSSVKYGYLGGVDITPLLCEAYGMQENETPEEIPDEDVAADKWLAENIREEPEEVLETSEGDESPTIDPEEPSEVTTSQERTPEAEKAIRFLKLQGLPDSMLETASEEDLLAAHQHRAKNEADVTRAFQENAELRRQIEELRASEGTGEPTSESPGELPEGLTAALGEEGAKALEAYLAQRTQAPQPEGLQELVPQLRTLLSQGTEERAKAELRDEFPEIDTRYPDVFKAYQELSKTSLYGDLDGPQRAKALFTDAARMLGLGNSPKPAPDPKQKVSGVTSARPQPKSVQKRKMTYEERSDAALALIMNEGVTDPEEIRSRLGR